jgi:hypothetical protein
VYLRAYGNVSEARASIGRYLDFYNDRRPHSSLDRRTIKPTSTSRHSAWQPNPGRPEILRTAMATAFFCPTNTTSRLPRVTPV